MRVLLLCWYRAVIHCKPRTVRSSRTTGRRCCGTSDYLADLGLTPWYAGACSGSSPCRACSIAPRSPVPQNCSDCTVCDMVEWRQTQLPGVRATVMAAERSLFGGASAADISNKGLQVLLHGPCLESRRQSQHGNGIRRCQETPRKCSFLRRPLPGGHAAHGQLARYPQTTHAASARWTLPPVRSVLLHQQCLLLVKSVLSAVLGDQTAVQHLRRLLWAQHRACWHCPTAIDRRMRFAPCVQCTRATLQSNSAEIVPVGDPVIVTPSVIAQPTYSPGHGQRSPARI